MLMQMKKLSEIINSQQLPTKNSKQFLENTSDKLEITVYGGELTNQCIVESSLKIRQSFPSLPVEFFDILADRLKEGGFNDERLKDAVNHVIDNCVYPTPTVAQFIGFDKRIKLYTYNQVLSMHDSYGDKLFEHFKSVRIGDNPKPVWANVNDINQYKLELWTKD